MHKYRKLNIHVPYSLKLVTSLDSIFSVILPRNDNRKRHYVPKYQ